MAHQAHTAPGFQWTDSLTIAAVNTITAADQTFTIKGIRKNRLYAVTFDDLDAGVISNGMAYGSAADTLKIRFANPTAGNITPGATVTRVVGI
jgi:hypothetical protein